MNFGLLSNWLSHPTPSTKEHSSYRAPASASQPESERLDEDFKGIVTLEQSDFDEFVLCMKTPKAPTETLLKGAELLKTLRRRSR